METPSRKVAAHEGGGSAMRTLDIVSAALLIIGGLNWGLVGLFDFDLVAALAGGLDFGQINAVSRLIYILVGVAALYEAVAIWSLRRRWRLSPVTA
jgi:uncharacterized membrane protein YuzA (DUF378 family)